MTQSQKAIIRETSAKSSRRALIGSSATYKQPTIELIRDGNRIEGIIVTCSCGETIKIACEYDLNADEHATDA